MNIDDLEALASEAEQFKDSRLFSALSNYIDDAIAAEKESVFSGAVDEVSFEKIVASRAKVLAYLEVAEWFDKIIERAAEAAKPETPWYKLQRRTR